MQPFLLDARDSPVRERRAWWSEQMVRHFGIGGEHGAASDDSFKARIEGAMAAPLTHFRLQVDGHMVDRSARLIRQSEWGWYVIYRELGPGAWFDIARQEVQTGPGDILISDGDSAMRTLSKAGYHHHLWMLPKAVLEPHLPLLPRPLLILMRASSGMTDLATAYIEALTHQFQTLSAAELVTVADHLARLIAIATGAATRSHIDALRQAKFEQAKQYVERRLTWPDLNPDRTAADLAISVRQLHMLFETAGETFSQYVRRRRLEECRLLLQHPKHAARSITDIAFGAGFASLPTFYRAFSAAFDAAPGDLRPRLIRP